MNNRFALMLGIALLAAGGGFGLAWMIEERKAEPEQLVPVGDGITPASSSVSLVGQNRPDFSLKTPDGREVSASNLDGKVVLINFWATWCEPCVEEMPMLNSVFNDLRYSGLHVLGIAVDEPARAAEFFSSLDLEYPLLVGLADVALVNRNYGNSSGLLPYSVLLDREGVVRWTRMGVLEEETLREEIAELL